MTRPPARWSGSELPTELSDALASADADASDDAIVRLRARLGSALGPAFDAASPLRPQARLESAPRNTRLPLAGKWIGIGAVLMMGLGTLAIRGPGTPAGLAADHVERAVVEVPPSAAEDPVGAGAVRDTSIGLATLPELAPPQPKAAPPTIKRNKQRAAPELGLAEELRQLDQIRQQLQASPARALAAADTHARLFAHGTLGPERELLRVDALLRLGRDAEAHKLAARMLAAPEGHPYRAQLTQLLTAK